MFSLCQGGSENAGGCHAHLKLCHPQLQAELAAHNEPIGYIIDNQSTLPNIPSSRPSPAQDGNYRCEFTWLDSNSKIQQCEYFSKESAGLKRHRLIHIATGKRYLCSLCGMNSDGASSVMDHVKRCHGKLNEELLARGEPIGKMIDTRESLTTNNNLSATKKRDRSSTSNKLSQQEILTTNNNYNNLLQSSHPNAHHITNLSNSSNSSTISNGTNGVVNPAEVKLQLLQLFNENKDKAELNNPMLSNNSAGWTVPPPRKRARPDEESSAMMIDNNKRISPLPAINSIIINSADHQNKLSNNEFYQLNIPSSSSTLSSLSPLPVIAQSNISNIVKYDGSAQSGDVDTEDEEETEKSNNINDLIMAEPSSTTIQQLAPLPPPNTENNNHNNNSNNNNEFHPSSSIHHIQNDSNIINNSIPIDSSQSHPASSSSTFVNSNGNYSESDRYQYYERFILALNERHEADQKRIQQLTAVIQILLTK